MRAELLRLAAELAGRGEPFALAVVVRREAACSAQPGDAALVTEDGSFHGWLGGSCTQPTVAREAQEAIADGRPRLLSLSPEPAAERRPGVAARPMTCASGGTVDIFLEPVLPRPRVVVFGLSPTARAVCRLARAMGYAVDLVDPGADRSSFPEADRVLPELPAPEPGRSRPSNLAAVVATMGQRDEEALLSALAHAPAYLGVVASRKRYSAIRQAVAGRGAGVAALERVKNPAGLDIGARTPDEIALSILAEVVQLQARRRAARAEPGEERQAVASAVDPICGMTVAVAGARHRAEYMGRTYYFCRAGCRERFLADPGRQAGVEAEAAP